MLLQSAFKEVNLLSLILEMKLFDSDPSKVILSWVSVFLEEQFPEEIPSYLNKIL